MQLLDPHGFHSPGSASAVLQGARTKTSEQGLHSPPFKKRWEIWKLTENLSTLSLISITRAVEVLTIAIKKNLLFHSRFTLNSSKKTHLQDLRLDQVPPTAQVTFYSDQQNFRHPINTSIISSMLIYNVNMILSDKMLPLIQVHADWGKTQNLGTGPVINSITPN